MVVFCAQSIFPIILHLNSKIEKKSQLYVRYMLQDLFHDKQSHVFLTYLMSHVIDRAADSLKLDVG